MINLAIVSKNKKEIIDITSPIKEILPVSGQGIVNIFVLHTTAAITIADLDPGTDLDMIDAFNAMMPKLNYRRYHNPQHVTDHILSSIIGNSLTLPYRDGELILGDWQRIVIVELNGPKKRDLVVNLIKSNE